MLYKLVETFEELKKYVFIIDRGNKGKIIIKFKDEYFFHLVGLQYTDIIRFIPNDIKSKSKQYKYIKKNIDRFDKILRNQIDEKDSLQLRMNSFPNILDLLNGEMTNLYNLKEKLPGSLYEGDYGLYKLYQDYCCLLGLKSDEEKEDIVICAPQTWMSDRRTLRLTKNKRPIYYQRINKISKELYNDPF